MRFLNAEASFEAEDRPAGGGATLGGWGVCLGSWRSFVRARAEDEVGRETEERWSALLDGQASGQSQHLYGHDGAYRGQGTRLVV